MSQQDFDILLKCSHFGLEFNCNISLLINETADETVVLNHINWGDVVRKLNGKVLHPIELSGWFVAFLALLCSVAFQPNVELFCRIASDKTLLRKPQYVIQLFIVCSNLFTLYTNVVQSSHFVLNQSTNGTDAGDEPVVAAVEDDDDDVDARGMCHMFVFVFGISYGTFLFNNLASLVECFVFLTFPLWHDDNVTVRCVVYWLIGLNSALIGAMKWPFVIGALPIHCAIQGLHNLTLQVILLFLFVFGFSFLVA